MSSTSNLEKLARKLLKEKYIEDSPVLTSEELSQLLDLIIKKSGGQHWRLVQHRNVEEKEIWYELDLQDGWSESSYEELE